MFEQSYMEGAKAKEGANQISGVFKFLTLCTVTHSRSSNKRDIFATVMNQIKTVVVFLKHLDCDISNGNFKKFLLRWSGLIMKEQAHSVENLL